MLTCSKARLTLMSRVISVMASTFDPSIMPCTTPTLLSSTTGWAGLSGITPDVPA
ncbi:hypothetical protein HED49_18925 [Ochrobactrum daejeonense]|nr:hypothetical protein [Brucella daejeonensis]